MPTKFRLGQTVNTPFGRAIYQFPMGLQYQVVEVVSYPVTTEIDLSAVQCFAYEGGIWKLVGLRDYEVKAI